MNQLLIMQTTSQSSTYPFNITMISLRSMQTVWTIFFFRYYVTAFTVTFDHILHHLNTGTQQKKLHPECKLIIIPHDNISLQSWQRVFKTSEESTPLTRCLFGTKCWILSCWLYYVTGLDIPANPLAQVNLISVNSLL